MKEIYGKQVYDSLREIINPKHTALIVVDVQNDFCSPEGRFAEGGQDVSMLQAMVPKVLNFLQEARKAQVMIIFVQNTMLSKGRSDSPAWLHWKSKLSGVVPEYTMKGTWGWAFCDGIQPRDGEPIIEKHRPSAFVNTDLDLVLRSNNMESIVVTGCVTQSCVLATARHAAFQDYYVVIAKDCVASTSHDLHEAALKIMETRLDVVNSQEIVKAWH